MNNAVVVRNLWVAFQLVNPAWQALVAMPIISLLAKLFRIKTKEVLKNVSFEVPEGSIFGILGVNGAGKTTLVKALVGLLTPSSGTIEFSKNLIISKVGRKELFPDFTALQTVRFYAKLHSLPVAEASEVALRLFKQFGMSYEDAVEKHVSALSLGTQGKVFMVLGLLPLEFARPDSRSLLVFDEPTLGFDVTAFKQFSEILIELRRCNPKLTIVIATNDVREASMCDRYICLTEGSVHESTEGLETLKRMVEPIFDAANQFANLVKPHASKDGGEQKPMKKPMGGKGIYAAIFYRSWIEVRQSPVINALVVLSLALPNIIGLFAATGRVISAEIILRTMIGIVASLLIRESFRLVQRERNTYFHVEMILLAPISQRRHLLAVTLQGLLQQLFYGVAACATLLVWLKFDPKFGHSLAQTQNFAVTQPWLLLAIFALTIISASGIGSTLILLPLLIDGTKAYFLISLVPLLTVFSSGLYYDPSALPPGLSLAANLNPFSYIADALGISISGGSTNTMLLTSKFSTALPGVSMLTLDILAVITLSTVAGLMGYVMYRLIDPAIRRTGGYCI